MKTLCESYIGNMDCTVTSLLVSGQREFVESRSPMTK